MGKTRELILVHQEMRSINILPASGINIMLTPQFYTLVREDLPVKYAYEAKRIAPSLFEGLLEENNSYDYFVEKEEEGWLFIAYNSEMIASFLEAKGINVEYISKMYFAEQSLEYFVAPVLLGEREVLINLSGRMTILPKMALDSSIQTIAITHSFTPQKGVKLARKENSLMPSNDAYTLVAILLLFCAIYLVEASRYGGSNEAEQEEIQLLLADTPSLESSYTRDSILSKYRSIDKKERMKREVIKSLSRMIFKGSILTQLTLDEKKFQASFECKDISIVKRVKALAKKENFRVSILGKTNLKIEGTL
jgi:hypothetical protein